MDEFEDMVTGNGEDENDNPYQEDEISEEELAEYEEKEKKAREELKSLFDNLMDDINTLQQSMHKYLDGNYDFIAGKFRLSVEKEDIENVGKMEDLNKFVSTSHAFLTDFYEFDNKEVSPKFDFIKNLIFKFQESFNNEQGRRFAIVHASKNEYYVSKDLIDKYLKGINIWLSRIVGVLEPARDYLMIAPPTKNVHGNRLENTSYGRFGSDIDNFYSNPYSRDGINSDNWWKRQNSHSFNPYGSKMNPNKKEIRDFGDSDS